MNPHVLISALIWTMLVSGASYHYGGKHKHDAMVAAQREVQDKAIAQHNADTVIDMQAAVDVEQTKAVQREGDLKRRSDLAIDIERRSRQAAESRAANPTCPVTTCSLDDRSLGLLRDAVSAANNKSPATAVVPDAMRGLAAPGERIGDRGARAPQPGDRALRGLPP